MREKFELACKIIGLLFFVAGIFALFAGLAFFLLYNALDKIPQSSMAIMSQSQIAELQDISDSMRNTYALMFLFGGIVEILLGFYLMKSNNLFIKLCYPFRNQNVSEIRASDIQLNVKSDQSKPESKKPSGDKYAPPGYFKK